MSMSSKTTPFNLGYIIAGWATVEEHSNLGPITGWVTGRQGLKTLTFTNLGLNIHISGRGP